MTRVAVSVKYEREGTKEEAKKKTKVKVITPGRLRIYLRDLRVFAFAFLLFQRNIANGNVSSPLCMIKRSEGEVTPL